MKMKDYYVFWRLDEDDFFGTLIQLEETFDPSHLTNSQWVQMAFDTEYPGQSYPVEDGVPASYELIEIIGGENIKFFMK